MSTRAKRELPVRAVRLTWPTPVPETPMLRCRPKRTLAIPSSGLATLRSVGWRHLSAWLELYGIQEMTRARDALLVSGLLVAVEGGGPSDSRFFEHRSDREWAKPISLYLRREDLTAAMAVVRLSAEAES